MHIMYMRTLSKELITKMAEGGMRPRDYGHSIISGSEEFADQDKQGQCAASGSDFVFDFTCNVCTDDGHANIEAVGYCTDCSEYLCDTCIRAHSRARPSRSHVVLDKTSMPKAKPVNIAKERTLSEVHIGPIKLQLVVGAFAEQKVDCLLIGTNEVLNLNSGLGKSLLNKGGNGLQDECKSKYDNHLDVGDIAEISGGNLFCKTIFLTVLPPHKNQAEKVLDGIVTAFLGLAQAKKYTSAAIPALGTGYLRYPGDAACRGMYTAVANWAKANPRTCLKNVRFVMFEKDADTIKVFQKHF